MSTTQFAVKYRPRSLKTYICYDGLKKTLTSMVENKKFPHTMLITGSTGQGKCIVGESVINTNEGLLHFDELIKKDGYIEAQYTVSSIDGVDTSAYTYKERAQTYKVSTKFTEIRGTAEHKLQVLTPELNIVWKRLVDIKPNDYIVGKTKKAQYIEAQEEYISPEMAKLLGFYFANGRNNRIFSSDSFVENQLQHTIFGKSYKHTAPNRVPYYVINGLNYDHFFGNHKGSRFKQIPIEVRKSNNKIIHSFLEGLFECDSGYNGEKIELVFSNKRACFEVSYLLNMIYDIKSMFFSRLKSAPNSSNPKERRYYTLLLSKHNSYKFCQAFPTSKVARNYGHIFTNPIQSKEESISIHIPYVVSNLLPYQKHFSRPFRAFLNRAQRDYIGLYKIDELLLEVEKIKSINKELYNKILFVLDYSNDYQQVASVKKSKITEVYDLNIPNSHAFIANGIVNHNTTLARILANAINNVPKGEECADIMEINIGDERGIDSARGIAQSVKYKPMNYPYKIVILDEVQQMTQQMASAMLKVIEEPPEHCIFILCTDQPDKLLKTIYGRCNVIKLEPLTPDMLVPMLSRVCKKEDLDIDDETLLKIAEASNGQPRYSLQILQQISYSKTADDDSIKSAIQEVLKETDDASVIRFIASLYKMNHKVLMETITNTTDFNSLINKSLELHRFMFDNLLKGQGVEVNHYYFTPNRMNLWNKINKDCKNWMELAPSVHGLLVDLRKEMFQYSINEYHLFMAKCLKWIDDNAPKDPM